VHIDEARALVRAYSRKPHEKDSELLSALEERIDHAVKSFGDAGAFVRLSTRSPKDSAIAHDRTMKFFEEELQKMGKGADKDENSRLIALIKASTLALRIFSGAEAMELIIKSERSNEDLLLALEFPDTWDMKAIIRKWVTIPPAMEFRGFVCGKKFTALSQYFHIVFFPELLSQKEVILQRIRQCFETLQAILPFDNYIIDFAVLEDEVLVIELNPFNDYLGCGTDPGLFSWKDDRDIVDGKAPFEFRIREEPFDVLSHIIGSWRQIVSVEK